MNPTKFDELTKELAKSTSRRRALKTILTASVGGVVGLGAIRTVLGDRIKCSGGPPNADCAHWCADVFGPDTPAAGRCTSDAAHNRGICCECGIVAPADICCVRNEFGYCVEGTIVDGCGCPEGQTCQNGVCGCSNPGVCGTYQTCEQAPCVCATTSEDGGACVDGSAICANLTDCTTSADCATGTICVVNSCCGRNVCAPLCGTDAAQRARIGSGPSIAN